MLEKRYKLPKKPSILVHPNRTAKSGKFDCHYYSLSVLLGYRQDDTKVCLFYNDIILFFIFAIVETYENSSCSFLYKFKMFIISEF